MARLGDSWGDTSRPWRITSWNNLKYSESSQESMIVWEWLTKHFHWRLTAEPIENGDISVPEEEIILVKKKLEQIVIKVQI